MSGSAPFSSPSFEEVFFTWNPDFYTTSSFVLNSQTKREDLYSDYLERKLKGSINLNHQNKPILDLISELQTGIAGQKKEDASIFQEHLKLIKNQFSQKNFPVKYLNRLKELLEAYPGLLTQPSFLNCIQAIIDLSFPPEVILLISRMSHYLQHFTTHELKPLLIEQIFSLTTDPLHAHGKFNQLCRVLQRQPALEQINILITALCDSPEKGRRHQSILELFKKFDPSIPCLPLEVSIKILKAIRLTMTTIGWVTISQLDVLIQDPTYDHIIQICDRLRSGEVLSRQQITVTLHNLQIRYPAYCENYPEWSALIKLMKHPSEAICVWIPFFYLLGQACLDVKNTLTLKNLFDIESYYPSDQLLHSKLMPLWLRKSRDDLDDAQLAKQIWLLNQLRDYYDKKLDTLRTFIVSLRSRPEIQHFQESLKVLSGYVLNPKIAIDFFTNGDSSTDYLEALQGALSTDSLFEYLHQSTHRPYLTQASTEAIVAKITTILKTRLLPGLGLDLIFNILFLKDIQRDGTLMADDSLKEESKYREAMRLIDILYKALLDPDAHSIEQLFLALLDKKPKYKIGHTGFYDCLKSLQTAPSLMSQLMVIRNIFEDPEFKPTGKRAQVLQDWLQKIINPENNSSHILTMALTRTILFGVYWKLCFEAPPELLKTIFRPLPQSDLMLTLNLTPKVSRRFVLSFTQGLLSDLESPEIKTESLRRLIQITLREKSQHPTYLKDLLHGIALELIRHRGADLLMTIFLPVVNLSELPGDADQTLLKSLIIQLAKPNLEITLIPEEHAENMAFLIFVLNRFWEENYQPLLDETLHKLALIGEFDPENSPIIQALRRHEIPLKEILLAMQGHGIEALIASRPDIVPFLQEALNEACQTRHWSDLSHILKQTDNTVFIDMATHALKGFNQTRHGALAHENADHLELCVLLEQKQPGILDRILCLPKEIEKAKDLLAKSSPAASLMLTMPTCVEIAHEASVSLDSLFLEISQLFHYFPKLAYQKMERALASLPEENLSQQITQWIQNEAFFLLMLVIEQRPQSIKEHHLNTIHSTLGQLFGTSVKTSLCIQIQKFCPTTFETWAKKTETSFTETLKVNSQVLSKVANYLKNFLGFQELRQLYFEIFPEDRLFSKHFSLLELIEKILGRLSIPSEKNEALFKIFNQKIIIDVLYGAKSPGLERFEGFTFLFKNLRMLLLSERSTSPRGLDSFMTLSTRAPQSSLPLYEFQSCLTDGKPSAVIPQLDQSSLMARL